MSLQDVFEAFSEQCLEGVFIENSGAHEGGITVHNPANYLKWDETSAEQAWSALLDHNGIALSVSLEDALNNSDLEEYEQELHFEACDSKFKTYVEFADKSLDEAKAAKKAALRAYYDLDDPYEYIDHLEYTDSDFSTTVAFIILKDLA